VELRRLRGRPLLFHLGPRIADAPRCGGTGDEFERSENPSAKDEVTGRRTLARLGSLSEPLGEPNSGPSKGFQGARRDDDLARPLVRGNADSARRDSLSVPVLPPARQARLPHGGHRRDDAGPRCGQGGPRRRLADQRWRGPPRSWRDPVPPLLTKSSVFGRGRHVAVSCLRKRRRQTSRREVAGLRTVAIPGHEAVAPGSSPSPVARRDLVVHGRIAQPGTGRPALGRRSPRGFDSVKASRSLPLRPRGRSPPERPRSFRPGGERFRP
jgi:hypothetical protein